MKKVIRDKIRHGQGKETEEKKRHLSVRKLKTPEVLIK